MAEGDDRRGGEGPEGPLTSHVISPPRTGGAGGTGPDAIRPPAGEQPPPGSEGQAGAPPATPGPYPGAESQAGAPPATPGPYPGAETQPGGPAPTFVPVESVVVAPPRAYGPPQGLGRPGSHQPPFQPQPPAARPKPTEPGLFALLAAGLFGTVRLPWLVLALSLARLLRLAAGWTPAVLLFSSLIALFFRGEAPEPGTIPTLLGLYLTGTLAGWLAELAVWSGGVPALDRAIEREQPPERGTFSAGMARTFPRFCRLALVWIVWQIVWGAAAWALLVAAGNIYGQSFEWGASGFWPASALAFIGTFFVLTTLASRWIFELAVARIGARGDGALEGLYEGARLWLRRFFAVTGALLLLGVLGAVAEHSLSAPLAMLRPSLASVGIWIVWQVPLAVAGAFVAVWRMGALVRATRELTLARVDDQPRTERISPSGPEGDARRSPSALSPSSPAPDAPDPL